MEQKEIKLSIVIPIFNTENYLDRCIESIINQEYREIEVILVDDGSPDKCPQKCDEWAEKDKRIQVIHKTNEGLGMARNTGIDNATGNYILFVDSDDYIVEHSLVKIVTAIKHYKTELLLFGFNFVDSKGIIKKQRIPTTEKLFYEGNEIQEYILPCLFFPYDQNHRKTNLWGSAWTCVYSVDLIQRCGWRFVSEREYVSEDVYSLLKLYKDVKSVSLISKPFYNYCDNMGSLTHAFDKEKFKKINRFYVDCISLCDANGYGNNVKESMFYMYFSNVVGYFKNVCASKQNVVYKYNLLKTMVKDNELQTNMRYINYEMESLGRKILIFAIRSKRVMLTYLLIKIMTFK